MHFTKSYAFQYPPRISFGAGCINELPEIIEFILEKEPSLVRCFLVCSPGGVKRGLPSLLEANSGIVPAGINAEVAGEPTLAAVDSLIREIRETKPELIIGAGGGSVIDAAKAAAVLAPVPGSKVTAYYNGEKSVNRRGLPFVAIPTTAGSGAEMTKNAVLTDPETQRKKSLRSLFMIPAASLVDPELTLSLPSRPTAESALDALTQAVESALSSRADSGSFALACQAIELLLSNLKRVWENGSDLEARTNVAEGSMLAGMAFSQSGLGAVHGLAHPIGVLMDLPHGYVCAVLLPYVLRYNAPASEKRLQSLARIAGMRDVASFIEAVEGLIRGLDIPPGLGNDGLTRDHFPFIIRNCRSNSMKSNPRAMPDEEVERLLEELII